MSPYATTLAHARLDALRKLIAALDEADTPEEKRRCAVAIFNAPDPSDLDDEIECEEDETDDADESDDALNQSESDSEVAQESKPDHAVPTGAHDLRCALDALMPSTSLTSSNPDSYAPHQIDLTSTISSLTFLPLTPS